MEDQPACSDSQRDLWRQYRKLISEYESKAIEVQLDLEQERKDLNAAAQHLKQIMEEIKVRKQQQQNYDDGTNKLRKELLTLQKRSTKESEELRASTKQKELANCKLEDLKLKMEADRERFAAHVAEQKGVIDEFSNFCKAVES